MSDADALVLARKALDGDAGALVRLVAQLVRGEGSEREAPVEIPPMNYTWKLPYRGGYGPRNTIEWEAPSSWIPNMALVGISFLTDLQWDEVPISHEINVSWFTVRGREASRMDQSIATQFLMRAPRRTSPFMPGLVFGRPYFVLENGSAVRIRFDNPTDHEHRTEVYLHGMVRFP